MLEYVTTSTAKHPENLVLWLHGLGADGNDFIGAVPPLASAGWPSSKFLFPHAPVRRVTLNDGMRMRAWFDLYGLDRFAKQDFDGILAMVDQLNELLNSQFSAGFRPERTFIAGFSQGAAMALALALTSTRTLGGAIALSGYLPIAEELESRLSPSNRAMPVFLGHGQLDAVVPLALGQLADSWLQSQGYAVEWQTFPIEHTVSMEELSALARWARAIFGGRDAH